MVAFRKACCFGNLCFIIQISIAMSIFFSVAMDESLTQIL